MISNSTSSFASQRTLQVAIVKGAIGNDNILSGDLESGIKKLKRRSLPLNNYDKNMGLCVAYLKNNNPVLSESACTSAIESISSKNLTSSHSLYLKAITYSNRGVARYLKNDLVGAMSDLTIAKSIDANNITKGNFKFIEHHSLAINHKS
jgi:hypothetical protein